MCVRPWPSEEGVLLRVLLAVVVAVVLRLSHRPVSQAPPINFACVAIQSYLEINPRTPRPEPDLLVNQLHDEIHPPHQPTLIETERAVVPAVS